MKIVHLGYEHSPKDTRVFYKECTSLAKAGHDVVYITSTREMGNLNTQLNGVRLITIEAAEGPRLKRYMRYLKELYNAALKEDADIYHIHEPLLMYVGLKLKKKNKKIIFDSHENFEGYWDDLFFIPKLIRKPLSKAIWKWLIKSVKKADGIVSATPFIAEQFNKYNVKSVAVCNYPIPDDIKFNNEDIDMRDNIACFAGCISEACGVDNIIKAMDDVDGKLIIAGKLFDKDRERMEKIKGWAKTEYAGFLSRDDINHLYGESCAGLVTFLPTKNYVDSLPIKMFEYMAAGIPVICSDFPLWQSIINENECGICVDPNNTDEISKAVNYILKNKDKAKAMGINGRKAVTEKYNWNIEERKLLDYYDKFKESEI